MVLRDRQAEGFIDPFDHDVYALDLSEPAVRTGLLTSPSTLAAVLISTVTDEDLAAYEEEPSDDPDAWLTPLLTTLGHDVSPTPPSSAVVVDAVPNVVATDVVQPADVAEVADEPEADVADEPEADVADGPEAEVADDLSDQSSVDDPSAISVHGPTNTDGPHDAQTDSVDSQGVKTITPTRPPKKARRKNHRRSAGVVGAILLGASAGYATFGSAKSSDPTSTSSTSLRLVPKTVPAPRVNRTTTARQGSTVRPAKPAALALVAPSGPAFAATTSIKPAGPAVPDDVDVLGMVLYASNTSMPSAPIVRVLPVPPVNAVGSLSSAPNPIPVASTTATTPQTTTTTRVTAGSTRTNATVRTIPSTTSPGGYVPTSLPYTPGSTASTTPAPSLGYVPSSVPYVPTAQATATRASSTVPAPALALPEPIVVPPGGLVIPTFGPSTTRPAIVAPSSSTSTATTTRLSATIPATPMPTVAPTTATPTTAAATTKATTTTATPTTIKAATTTTPKAPTGSFPTIVVRPASEGRDAPALPSDAETPLASSTPTTTAVKTYTFIGATNPPPAPHPGAAAAVAEALTKLGMPYLWGGEGPDGYDCSGLSLIAWKAAGVKLPHQSQLQFNRTARVNLADIVPGDLVFFGDPIHHLGIYIGDGKMIEAPKPGVNIRTVSIKRKDLVGVGRVTA